MKKANGGERETLSDSELATALKRVRSGEAVERGARRGKTPEEKAKAEADQLARKEQRRKEREQRRALRPAKVPAHMRKVERAAAKLPKMPPELQRLAEELGSLDAAAIQAFIANVQHSLRARMTLESVSRSLENGQLVRIVSGNPQYVGQLARVVEARRIRCHVTPVGTDRKVYLLNSDVRGVDEAELIAAPADERADDEELDEAKSA